MVMAPDAPVMESTETEAPDSVEEEVSDSVETPPEEPDEPVNDEPVSQEPPKLTYEEFQQLEERRQTEVARAKAQQDLATAGPNLLRNMNAALVNLADKYGITFTLADHESVTQFAEQFHGQALEAAKLELGNMPEAAKAANARLLEVSEGFYKSLPASDHNAFTAKVNGKPAETWLSTFRDMTAANTRKETTSALAEAAAAEFPVDAPWLADLPKPHADKMASLRKDLAKAKTPADVHKVSMAMARVRGNVDPIDEPAGGEGQALPGRVTYAALQKMTPAQIQALPSDVFNAAIAEG